MNKDNVWSSCINYPITLDCEIPQYLEIFTFHHSLRLLFIPVVSSFQFTFTTKLPVDTPCYVLMPSFVFCLRQLTSLTHHMGHRFSLAPAHSAQGGFCCVIYVVFRIICSQGLFLGAAYQGLSISFQISFSNPLPSSIPVSTFLISHILPMHSFCFLSFSVPFTSFTLYSFRSTASEVLTTLLSPTFLSSTSSLFLTYQLKLFSSHLAQLSQLIRPLPPFFLGTYILAISLLGCSSLFIVMIFLDFLSNS